MNHYAVLMALLFPMIAVANTETIIPTADRCDQVLFEGANTLKQHFLFCRLKSGNYAYQQNDEVYEFNNVAFIADKDHTKFNHTTQEGKVLSSISLTAPTNVTYTATTWMNEQKQRVGHVKLSIEGDVILTFGVDPDRITGKIEGE